MIGRGSRWSRRAIFHIGSRIAFFAYLAFLTVLLLTRDPSKFIGIQTTLLDLLRPLAHLLSFLVLGVLAMAANWSRAFWAVLLGLMSYAAGTELLQGLVSQRTPEWADWFQDVAGIVIGVVVYRLGVAVYPRIQGMAGTRKDGVSADQESS